jgi:hypothetical protein
MRSAHSRRLAPFLSRNRRPTDFPPFMAASTELHRSTALPTPPLSSPRYIRRARAPASSHQSSSSLLVHSAAVRRPHRLKQSVPVGRRSILQPRALPEQAAPTASSARTSQHRRLSPTPEHRWPRECPRCRHPSASGTEPEATSKSGHSGSSPSLVSTHQRSPRSPLSILLTPEFLSRRIARIFWPARDLLSAGHGVQETIVTTKKKR